MWTMFVLLVTSMFMVVLVVGDVTNITEGVYQYHDYESLFECQVDNRLSTVSFTLGLCHQVAATSYKKYESCSVHDDDNSVSYVLSYYSDSSCTTQTSTGTYSPYTTECGTSAIVYKGECNSEPDDFGNPVYLALYHDSPGCGSDVYKWQAYYNGYNSFVGCSDDCTDRTYYSISYECRESSNDDFCFNGAETVDIEGKGVIPIADVHISDRVKVWTVESGFSYSDVIFVPHGENFVTTDFIHLTTALRSLIITPAHLIFAGECSGSPTLIEAWSVKVGMCVLTEIGLDAVLNATTRVGHGVYSIVPYSGFLVVNGVIASPYAVNHWIVDKYYYIHRILYSLYPSVLDSVIIAELNVWVSNTVMSLANLLPR